MLRRHLLSGAAALTLAFVAACSQAPQTPVSASPASGSAAANVDGSTLKVTAPVVLSPRASEQVDTRRPELVFGNSTAKFASVALQYRIEIYDAAGNLLGARLVSQGGGSQTTYSSEADLAFDTVYSWRVRAELEDQVGPWSGAETFRGPARPVAGGPFTGSVGQPRDIGVNEAANIIYSIYQAGRWDISGRTPRERLNLFLEIAVAALHYGHPRYNAEGPDSNWCIKNGGPGRPQSDDVIVRCTTREAWDLVSGIGGSNPFWVTSYVGRLDNAQQIYAPRRSTLDLLP